MDINTQQTSIINCKIGRIDQKFDNRGSFQKIYQASKINQILPEFSLEESYITNSHQGVLRGMHFQIPPSDHSKVVICLQGEVHDVFLDLRQGQHYGKVDSVILSEHEQNVIFLPSGIAHGFLTLSKNATLLYLVSSEYNPAHDRGIMWDSFEHNWPIKNPIISDRDTRHAKFSEFDAISSWSQHD
jgi:dTDP-4-dehydrorhamnose 3,5-epimerase